MSQSQRQPRNVQRSGAQLPSSAIEGIRQQVTVDNLPLPSPETLRGYGEVVPTAPQLFFDLWEAQTRHRIESEQRVMEANIRALDANIGHTRRNAWMAYSLAVLLIAAFVVVALFTRNALVGVGGLVFSLAGIITTFLVNSRRQERILRLQMSGQQRGN
jgi:uncharacterized membrane protein